MEINKTRNEYYKIKWFPMIQLCFLPIIVVRQLNYHFQFNKDGENTFWLNALLLIAGGFACSNGLFNTLAYAWNQETRDKICNRKKPNETELSAHLVNRTHI